MASDDLRARLAAALRGIRFGLGTNTRYGLSGNEIEAATEQLLPTVQAELDRRDKRIEDYRASRKRWMEAAFADRHDSNAAAEARDKAQAERDRAERELADWRSAAYEASRERDNARIACRSAAVLLRAVADRGTDVGALLAAADDLDNVASDRPWLTIPPTPCSPVRCDPCHLCKTTTIEESR